MKRMLSQLLSAFLSSQRGHRAPGRRRPVRHAPGPRRHGGSPLRMALRKVLRRI